MSPSPRLAESRHLETLSVSRRVFLGGLSTAALHSFVPRSSAAETDGILGHGSHRYAVDAEWGARHLPTNRPPILNCHEMVRDSKGRLIMLGDHVANNVLIYDEEGHLLETWGTQYPGGHGLTIARTPKGEECLWIVDCGWFQKSGKWNRQQGRVVQTDLTGRVLMDIGHPCTYGAYEPGMNYMPTETAVGPDGSIYIADGYGSNYILRFDAHGRYLGKFGGSRSTDDVPAAALSSAHGIAVDLRDPTQPTLLVTSRSENCFKRFTLEGKYLSTISIPGAYVCRAVISGDLLLAGVCWSKEGGTGKRLGESGFVVILDKNDRVISAPGGTEPQYVDGVLQPLSQAPGKAIKHGHDVCPDSQGNLIVCQWNAGNTYPVRLVKQQG
jgi:peptidylglycine monooxygenase